MNSKGGAPPMTVLVETDRGFLHIRFSHKWAFISCVRGFIENFCAITFTDKILANRFSLASSELLENAIKYSNDGCAEISIRLEPGTGMLTVKNRADSEHRTILRQEVEKIQQGTPLEAYLRKIREIARSDQGPHRLGLARIRYDTGADAINVDADGEVVTVSIGYEYPGRSGPAPELS